MKWEIDEEQKSRRRLLRLCHHLLHHRGITVNRASSLRRITVPSFSSTAGDFVALVFVKLHLARSIEADNHLNIILYSSNPRPHAANLEPSVLSLETIYLHHHPLRNEVESEIQKPSLYCGFLVEFVSIWQKLWVIGFGTEGFRLKQKTVTMNNNFYFQGLYLTSSSIGSAMYNLSPAIIFVVAAIFGMEQIKIGSIRSIAKILGEVICVGGAASMAFFKGPKLLNPEYLPENSSLLLGREADNWLLGCFLLFGASWCWSLLLILQVPVTASHPDNLSSVAWLSLFGAIQSAAVTFFIEPNSNSWHINSYLELWTYLFCGAISSGLGFFLQAWCISQRGPIFVSLFNPLCTVIIILEAVHTSILAAGAGMNNDNMNVA